MTVPLPVPLPPLVTVIHGSLLVAVHAQADCVVTVTLFVPAIDVNACVVGDAVNVHGALCVIVTVWPATVSVPVRDVVPVFAVTL